MAIEADESAHDHAAPQQQADSTTQAGETSTSEGSGKAGDGGSGGSKRRPAAAAQDAGNSGKTTRGRGKAGAKTTETASDEAAAGTKVVAGDAAKPGRKAAAGKRTPASAAKAGAGEAVDSADSGPDTAASAPAGRAKPAAARRRATPVASPAKAAARSASPAGRRPKAASGNDETTAPVASSVGSGGKARSPQADEGSKALVEASKGGRGQGEVTAKEAKEAKKLWNPMAPFSAYARASEKLLVRMRPEKVTTPAQVIKEIEEGPQGPKVIAAFDFDGTLVGGFTGAWLMQERMKRKEVTRAEIADTAGVTFKAMAKLLEANEVVAHSMAQWAGKTEQEMEDLGAHLFADKIQDMVFPEMREIVAAHRAAGHTIVVATSASRFQVEPTVESLGIDNLLCTQVEVEEGKLTGKLVGDSLFGPGKVAAIKKFVAEHDANLADTYFYADGDEECGLMEAVGHPHPVNPSRKLADAARAKGWPVLRLQSRGSAKPANFVRGAAGLISIMPILQAGLAVGLMSRDKRQAANMIMPTWIQTQLDLAGVKLRVSGRKNLWAQRPAVFIFNHRNNYDGSFVAALVRTDYVSLAKKDMVNNPVGKLVAAIMPTVFIDRGSGDGQKAADTLQPVVDAVGKGYSIMLAPEGTRVAGNLNSVGPFKKGAFHMAMAAGIPVVPVVIRNALDVASRDGGAMRPGVVDIAVLPPISVADWTRENMGDKVEEVRQLYIDTLNNWPEPDPDQDVEE